MEKKDEHCQVAFLWLISIIDVLISWLFISHKYHVCCGSDIVAFLKADPSEVLRSFNLPPGRIILVEAIANVSPINNKVSQPHKYTYIYIYMCKYSYMYMYIYIYIWVYIYNRHTHIYIYKEHIIYGPLALAQKKVWIVPRWSMRMDRSGAPWFVEYGSPLGFNLLSGPEILNHSHIHV